MNARRRQTAAHRTAIVINVRTKILVIHLLKRDGLFNVARNTALFRYGLYESIEVDRLNGTAFWFNFRRRTLECKGLRRSLNIANAFFRRFVTPHANKIFTWMNERDRAHCLHRHVLLVQGLENQLLTIRSLKERASVFFHRNNAKRNSRRIFRSKTDEGGIHPGIGFRNDLKNAQTFNWTICWEGAIVNIHIHNPDRRRLVRVDKIFALSGLLRDDRGALTRA